MNKPRYNPATDRWFPLACGHNAYPDDVSYKPAGAPLQWLCSRCDQWTARMPAAVRREQAQARRPVQGELF